MAAIKVDQNFWQGEEAFGSPGANVVKVLLSCHKYHKGQVACNSNRKVSIKTMSRYFRVSLHFFYAVSDYIRFTLDSLALLELWYAI